MTTQRILVTGATGFVGSHVADALASAGLAMRALVRPASRTAHLEAAGAEVVRGSLDDPAALAGAVAGTDVVVHLAARTHARSESEYHRVNARATEALVTAMLDAGPGPRRIVYLSSLAAVGPAREGQPVRPQDEPRPLTAYGRSKLQGEEACRAAAGRIEVVVLRAPGVYGPRDREILRFFRFARLGWVPLPAGGPRPIQLVHATDLARAVLLATARPGIAGTFHIAEPRAYTMDEIAGLVAAALGTRARILHVPGPLVHGLAAVSELATRAAGRSSMLNRDKVREFMAAGWLCETEAARQALGFEARIPLPDGLRETAAWYREKGWLT